MPDTSQSKFRLVDAQGKGPIIRFSQLQSRLEHGQYLEKQNRSPNEDPSVIATYRILPIPAIREKTKPVGSKAIPPINFVRAGRGKEIHLTSNLNVGYYRTVMTRSYNFVNTGCRVEMHMRISKPDLVAGNRKSLDEILAENPHYRPEIILQGMPDGASIKYGPFYDEDTKKLIWVMSNDEKWTKRSRATGCHIKAMAPPTDQAVDVLKRLPVIE
ncbi:MAG: hypothetical protein Q9188_001680 [Gyalolechia gomerana]